MDRQLIDYIIHRVESIDNKVDELLKFKWQIIGGSALIAFVVTLSIQILAIYIDIGGK